MLEPIERSFDGPSPMAVNGEVMEVNGLRRGKRDNAPRKEQRSIYPPTGNWGTE